MNSQNENLHDYIASYLGMDSVDEKTCSATLKALDIELAKIKTDHGGKDAKTDRQD